MFARKLSIKESTLLKKPTAILQTKFLSRGMSSAMRSERQKKLSLLAGKLSIEKKVCGFELCLCLYCWAKDIQVFWREKSCIVPFLFSHQKSRIYFVLTLDPVQIRRIFFSLGNPPYAKKSKREPIFWLVTRPFSQRKISLFSLVLNSRHKRDHIIWKHKFYLPLSLFTKYKYILTSANVGKHNWTPKE